MNELATREIDELRSKLSQFSPELETSIFEKQESIDLLINYVKDFYSDLPERKTYNPDYARSAADDFLELNGAADLSTILHYIKERIDAKGLNAVSAGHLGYIPGGGIFEGAIGDFIAAVGNQYAGVFYASPGAVRLENSLIKWAGELVGYDKGFGGNLTSGGSMANLIAISTARHAKKITSAQVPKAVVYTTRQTHHSLLKALRINGLYECVLRVIPTDNRFRTNVEALKETITQDREAGLLPFLVISNAGTTDVGAVDPLREVAAVATEYDLWHHVDAAYGGFFLLTEYGRNKLDGIELADSVILDPHKGLFLPYGSGMVLIKDGVQLYNAFAQEANYMQDVKLSDAELSPSDLSPELSKHFRGMRMWLPLKLHGVDKFAKALDEKLLLARYFHERVGELGYETGPDPDLSVVLFRLDAGEDSNAVNKQIMADIHAKCAVFISSTTINDVYWMRAAILSFRTHVKEVDILLDFLKPYAQN